MGVSRAGGLDLTTRQPDQEPEPRFDLSLILPAYDEAASIGRTIAEAQEYGRTRGLSLEILVAADGEDGTREIVAELARTEPSLRLLGTPERRGKGRGVREAASLARGAVIGYADADGKVPFAELDALLPWLADGFDGAIGTRAHPHSRIERRAPWFRRAGSRAFRLLRRAITGLSDFDDTQCGFKFFRRDAALRLFPLQKIDGYMFDVELLLLARDLGLKIREVPVRWRDDGDSRFDLVSGSLRDLGELIRIRRSTAR